MNDSSAAHREALEKAINNLQECAETMLHVAKGYRCSDEEDDYLKCPSCGGWIDHYGHVPTCELLVMSGRALKSAEALETLATPAASAPEVGEAKALTELVKDLRVMQYAIQLGPHSRMVSGKAADALERLSRPAPTPGGPKTHWTVDSLRDAMNAAYHKWTGSTYSLDGMDYIARAALAHLFSPPTPEAAQPSGEADDWKRLGAALCKWPGSTGRYSWPTSAQPNANDPEYMSLHTNDLHLPTVFRAMFGGES